MVEEKVRVELTVHGSVQMVSFRYRVSDIADELGIVGRIINKSDKTVHIIAEGEKSKIQEFTERIKIRPLSPEQIMGLEDRGEFVPPQPLAKVEKVDLTGRRFGDNLFKDVSVGEDTVELEIPEEIAPQEYEEKEVELERFYDDSGNLTGLRIRCKCGEVIELEFAQD